MKYPIAFCFILFILSCGNNSTLSTSPSDQIIVKDSGIIKKEAPNPYVPVDVSPMDMAYFPIDYAVNKMSGHTNEQPLARIIYSRPHRAGRKLFGGLVVWGQPWRLGANEATEIEFYKDVKVGAKKIKKGRYTLYALPTATVWTLIFNKETDTWGAFKYDSTKDIARVDVPVQKQSDVTEVFSILFEKNTANSANMLIAWDDVLVKLPISW